MVRPLMALIGGWLAATAATIAVADITFPAGRLILDMGAQNEWRLEDDSGVVARQSLSTPPGSNNCELLAGGPDSLVVVSGSAPGPGFLDRNNRELLGVVGPGTDCGRVNSNEQITFTLDESAGSALQDKVFATVDLALNVKQNAIIVADVRKDGAANGSFVLYSGQSIPNRALEPNESSCAPGADSAPDSDATNCEWFFAGVGDEIRLNVTVGEAGIGGQGSASVFEIASLVEATGEIDCENNNTTEVIEYLNSPGGEGTNAFVQCTRLNNVEPDPDGDNTCEVVDYSLTAGCENGDCGVTFLHALEADDPVSTTKYAFLCETWWPEQTGTFANGELQVPKSAQFFGPNELQGTDLDFCEGVTPRFDAGAPACTYESGGTVGSCSIADIDSVEVPPALDHQGQIAGQQVGCLLDQRVRQTEDTAGGAVIEFLFKLYELWYLQGDYRVSRGF